MAREAYELYKEALYQVDECRGLLRRAIKDAELACMVYILDLSRRHPKASLDDVGRILDKAPSLVHRPDGLELAFNLTEIRSDPDGS